MIVFVGDDDAVKLRVVGDAGWSVELSRTRPVRAKLAHKLARAVKYLYAIVGAIGDYNVAARVTAHAPRTAKLSIAVALAATVYAKHRFSDGAIVASALHLNAEWTALYMASVDKHRYQVDTIHGRAIVNHIGAVLFVTYVDAIQLLVGSLYEHAYRVTAYAPQLAQVILGLYKKGGHFGLKRLTQAVAVGDGVGCESGAGKEAHLSESGVKGGIGRCEEQLVCLAWLKKRQQLMVVVGVVGFERLQLF